MKQTSALVATLLVMQVCVSLASSPTYAQKPRVPASDDEVLQRLPKTLSLNRDRMATIREKLAADPSNSQFAAAAAKGFIRMGNEESDPRFYGYARAAIEAWWTAESPPAEIVKLRAKLKEKDHKYREAIVDLKNLLDRQPSDAQAWVELVNLYRVTGEYEEAWSASQHLEEFADATTVMVSQIPVLANIGAADEAYEKLQQLLKIAPEKMPELVPWIVGTQASIDAMLHRVEAADTNFRKALTLDSGNIHLKRTYADFLLDFQQPAPVLKLLAEHENDNGCLLLMAIAAKRLRQTELLDRLKEKIEVRFEEIRLRGSKPHGRFESRYQLTLNRNPKRALEVALENWQLQKEIRDSRAVLEAALEADDQAAAEPIVDFVKASDCEDFALIKLLERLGSDSE